MKDKKDYSNLMAYIVGLAASLFLSFVTVKAAVFEDTAVAVLSLAFLLMVYISVEGIYKEIKNLK